MTKKCLSRRTVLRSVGVAIALPFLDAMTPAFAAPLQSKPPRRLGVIYVPNGMMMLDWRPLTEGPKFELTPILRPLEPFRDRLLVLSGLNARYGWPQPAEGAGDHARAAATFLTGVHVKKTEGADIHAGVSMDQIAAKQLGRETQLSSLELALESVEFLGSCDAGYSCAYANTIAWRTPTTPLPMESDPRAVFERLFGATDSTDAGARLARIQADRSILDSVIQKIAGLQVQLAPRDRLKLTEFLDAVRDVERRIQKAEEQRDRTLPSVGRPAGMPSSFQEHAELMFDLLALAYQTDLTRVSTFMMGREVSSRAYPEIGVPDSHHGVSHHQNDPDKLAKLARINILHMQIFVRFLEKLRSTPEGDGSLLDHSLIVYGAGISDSNVHMHDDLPIVVTGGAGTLTGGRHLRYAKETPLTNLHVTLLDKLGVPVETLGDSTGRLDHLTGM